MQILPKDQRDTSHNDQSQEAVRFVSCRVVNFASEPTSYVFTCEKNHMTNHIALHF